MEFFKNLKFAWNYAKNQKRLEWKFYGGGCTAYDSADSVAYRPYLSWILSA